MKKDSGKWQQRIILALDTQPFIPVLWRLLEDDEHYISCYSALHRAAKRLEKQGKCVTFLLWNDDHTKLCSGVARNDFTFQDKPIKKLSVERVPNGTHSTYTNSYRYIASMTGVSKSTVHRSINGKVKKAVHHD